MGGAGTSSRRAQAFRDAAVGDWGPARHLVSDALGSWNEITVGTTEHADPPILKRRGVLLVAVVVGVSLGVFSLVADGVFRARVFEVLGNLASLWGLAAFFVGYRAASWR